MSRSDDSGEIAIFDFLSHAEMHHAFNEGYLRTIRSAFPDSAISFYAGEGQLRNLSQRVVDIRGLTLRACGTFSTPFGMSRHNPLAGHWAARRCLQTISERISPSRTKLVSVLGVDANLFAVLGRRWPRVSAAPLHMILHSHLGEAMVWRSRNPLFRCGDFISGLRLSLPPGVFLVVLELGIKSAIEELAPHLGPSIITLEHPLLESEWLTVSPLCSSEKLKIAFLGHARNAKGYPVFLDLARQCAHSNFEFQAIGLSSTDTLHLDASSLTRTPSPTPLPRHEYLNALAAVDMVCLPLHKRAYDFTGSGTLTDAIGSLKPLLGIRNRTLDQVEREYGEIGCLVDAPEQLPGALAGLTRKKIDLFHQTWVTNLAAIRERRRPARLGPGYASLIANARSRH